MKWRKGSIHDVTVRALRTFTDSRGWLAEIFRDDEMPADILPAMSYVSVTHAGITRGPHAHHEQTDVFAFLGPGDFRVRLWDPRPDSPTAGITQTLLAGETAPTLLIIPPGIVHAYTNTGDHDAWVMNYPNRLYAGKGRSEPVDESRYENDPQSPFRIEDEGE